MTHFTSTQDQIQELRRKISVIEWDFPNLKNEELKDRREKELNSAKNRLTKLLNEENAENNIV